MLTTAGISDTYTYDQYGALDTITSAIGNVTKFVYGAAGNMTAVRVGGNPIANYNYANGNLTWAEYNSQRITYGYTDNRLTTVTNAAGPTGITYNDYGQVTKIAGVGNGGATYGYDYNVDNLDGAFYVINGANRIDATYDFPIGSNQATATYVLNNNSTAISKTTEVYNSKGLLEYVNGYGHGNITYVYDDLDRLKEKSGVYSGSNTLQTYSYRNGASGTTSQIELDKYSIKGVLVSQYKYEYFTSGNVKNIRNAATNALIQEFQYDSFDRLFVEKNYTLNRTFTYAYNNGGNITSRTEKNLSTGAVIGTYSYGYTNSAWKDQLTSYNGKSIAYDAAGNPTSYLDLTLTWQNGKQLKTVANAKHGGTTWGTITMEYDASGLRTKKSRSGGINTCDQYYYWQGNKLLAEQHGSLFLYYYYDETGVCGFNRAGADYYFQKNILGDIIAIYNTSGTKVGSYEYDAWGNTTVTNYTSDIIADWNPFRYRGYYQDQETGFYYLQSRYYDPQTGRFINADEPKIATLGLGIVNGSNLYSYCLNNPVMYTDPSGMFTLGTFLDGTALAILGTCAIIVGVATFPIGGWAAVAGGIAILGGAGVIAFGAAEMGEAIWDYNYIRDGVFDGNRGKYDTALNISIMCATIGASLSAMLYESGYRPDPSFKIGRIGGVQKSGAAIRGYYGVRYTASNGKIHSIEIHPNHNNHGIHLQLNHWALTYPKNPGLYTLMGAIWRWAI